MRKFAALFRVSFWGMLHAMNLAGGSRRRRVSGAGVLVLAGGLMLGLSSLYSFSIATTLSLGGSLDLLPLLMALVAVALCAVLGVFGAQGILFGTKDRDLALSWPVPPLWLVLSRVLALYLENLFLLELWMLPPWLIWLFLSGESPASVLGLLAGVVLLAFLPSFFAMAVGFLLTLVSARFTHKALVGNLLYLLLFVGILVGSFAMQNSLAARPDALLSAAAMRPLVWFVAVLRLQEGSLAALAAFCLLPFLALAWLVSLRYTAILTLLASHQARFDYKLTRRRSAGRMRALILREFRRYFGISIYLFNTGIGLLLLAAAAVAALVQKSQLEALLTMSDLADVPVPALVALTVGFVLSMTQPTSCSISLEGNQLWILKTAPLRPAELFGSKAAMQLLLTLPVTLVCTPALCWAFGLSAGQTLSLLAASLAFCLCIAPMGLLVNLQFPKLDAVNPTVVVKQSAATLVGLLGGWALLAPGALFYWLFPAAGDGCAWLAACALCYLLAAALFWRVLLTWGAKRLESL